MINFIAGSPQNALDFMTRYGAGECAGQMSSPHAGNLINTLNLPWVLDNGCYQPGYDPPAILRMLKRFHAIPGCKFAVVPDAWGDHAVTRLLFNAWIGTYHAYDYPPAFVLQNGIASSKDIPWDSIAAVFIGGDDVFKFSLLVRGLVDEAKGRGKWVHMGRVNTLTRIVYAASIGCDSTDGTGFARFREKYRFAQAFNQVQHQLWETI